MPILTVSCHIDAINETWNGLFDVDVTWFYSDDTSFGTTISGMTFTDRDDLIAQLRATVAGPNGEEQAITFSGPDN